MSMETYIALTALQTHWGRPEDTVMLGEWCRSCHENISYLHYSDKVISRRWLDPDELERAAWYCLETEHKVAPVLAEHLIQELKIDLDSIALKRIFWSWLLTFIHVVYDRYQVIEDAVAYNSDACFITAPPEASVLPAKSPLDGLWPLAHGASVDRNNLVLFSQIISFFGLRQKVVPIPKSYSPSIVHWHRWNKSIKGHIRQIPLYAKMFFYRNSFYYYSNLYTSVTQKYSSWIFGELMPPTQGVRIRHDLRGKMLDYGTCDFTRLLAKLIPIYIPWGVCEALPGLIEWAKKHPARFAKFFVTAIGGQVNTPLAVLANIAKRPLIVVDHSGGAAMFLRNNPIPELDKFTSSTGFDAVRLRRELPSPHLSRKLPDIPVRLPPVLVCNEVYRYPIRFMSGFMPSHAKQYHQARIDFLRAIPAALAPVVRLYFMEVGWGVQSVLQEEFPYLHFQDPHKIKIDYVYAASSLIICDHPLSTLHFTLARNLPVIFFSAAGTYDYNERGRRVMGIMERAKICHSTPKSAAQHYCSVYGDVSAWWNSGDVQDAVNAYRDKYVKMSDDWQRDWNLLLDNASAEN